MTPLFDHDISMLCYAEMNDFQNSELVGGKLPRIGRSFLSDMVLARFVIYNGVDKAEVLNGKEVIYTGDYVCFARII